MPELPEVETTKNGIKDAIVHQRVKEVIIRFPKLRWEIPPQLPTILVGQKLLGVKRRAKYLLLKFEAGTLIMHLGMSGKLRVLKRKTEPQKHDHFEIIFANQVILHLNDKRRFGCVLWCEGDACEHELIKDLGVEPLEKDFSAAYLAQACKKRRGAIKQAIMDAKIVVGVGNIYASEALFLSGIHPQMPANQLTLSEYQQLVEQIKIVLQRSIKVGGTTLKDFAKADGSPGYFKQRLNVYGRDGKACPNCSNPIKKINQAGRSTFYCETCQVRKESKHDSEKKQ